MSTRPLLKFLFGATRELRRKQIRQFCAAVGAVLILCVTLGALVYLASRQGRI